MMLLRLALRDLRGGLAGFRIFLLCLALGVAAIAGIGTVRAAVEAGLRANAAEILGGDARLTLTYRYADEAERAWLKGAGELSEIVEFRSMIGAGDAAADRALVEVAGVDEAYPLVGEVVLDPPMPLAEALAGYGARPGLVADRALVARIGARPGDIVTLAGHEFRLTARLVERPDRDLGGFNFAPPVIAALDAVRAAGLTDQGSLFESEYRLRLPPTALAEIRADAQEIFAGKGMRWRDISNGAPGASQIANRMGAFLILLSLAALAVGGIGVSAAVRGWLDGRISTIATLRSIGMTGGGVMRLFALQIALMAALGIAIGLIVGIGVPLLLAGPIGAALPFPATFKLYPRPVIEALTYGAMIAALFTILPIARLRNVKIAALYRREWGDARLGRAAGVAASLLLVALIGAAALFSGMVTLTLWLALGLGAAMLMLWLAARAISRVAAGARRRVAGPVRRLSLAALTGPRSDLTPAMLSLGLGLTVLATIGQVDSNLRYALANELPERAPAFFLVDIQQSQSAPLQTILTEAGAEDIETAPMLRGILTGINGRPAQEVAHDHWVLAGDRGVTIAGPKPAKTTLTDGEWWDADTDEALVSFAAEEAEELGLKVGDRLVVNILGRDVEVTIANLRVVEFSDMGINFIMVMSPASLAGAPFTEIATVFGAQEDESRMLRAIAEAAPNVTAISVREGLARARRTLEDLTAATRWSALATLLTGFTVLIGAAAMAAQARTQEAAILKTLGATRGRILAIHALGAGWTGLAAGAIALAAGALGSWAVMRFVFEASWRFDWTGGLITIGLGLLTALVARMAFVAAPLSVRPARILRSED